MKSGELHKIINYNFLCRFSKIEKKIKEKFKDTISNSVDEDLKRNFIFLHLSEEIKSKFDEDFSNISFQIKKINYKNNIEQINVKWNLKKCLEFSKENNLLNEIVNRYIKSFQKREELPVYSILIASIQIRNSLAHDTFNIEIKRELELLSDEKLAKLADEDDEFSDASEIGRLDSTYKHALTYYFYLGEIEKLL